MRNALKASLLISVALCGRGYAQVSIANEPPASLPTSGSDLAVIDQYNSGLSKWVTKRVPLSALIPPAGITASMMATGAAAFNLGSGGVTAALIAPGAAASNIGAGGVTSSMLAGGAAAANIGTGGVTASLLASGVAASNIGTGGVTAAMLASGAAASNIGTGGVTASLLASGVAASNIGTGGVTAAMLASGVAASNIGAGGVTAAMLASSALSSNLPSGTAGIGLVYAPAGAAGTAQIAGPMAGFRNRLINGDFRIWQRGTSVSTGVATSTYLADRWIGYATGAAVTMAQVAAPAGFGLTYGLQLTGAASNTGALISQRIEASNAQDLALAGTVSVQAVISCSPTQTITYNISYPTVTDNYGSTTIGASNVWTATSTPTRFTGTLAVTSSAQYGAALLLSIPGLLSGASCTFSGVQLEAGSYATPFERRPYGSELALAQRYFMSYTAQPIGVNISTAWAGSMLYFPVPMRVVPSPSNTSFPSGGGTFLATGISIYGSTMANTGGSWSASPAVTFISFTGQFSAEL